MIRRRYGAIVLSLDRRTARGRQRIKCKTAVKSRSSSFGQVTGNSHSSVTAAGRSITRERDDEGEPTIQPKVNSKYPIMTCLVKTYTLICPQKTRPAIASFLKKFYRPFSLFIAG